MSASPVVDRQADGSSDPPVRNTTAVRWLTFGAELLIAGYAVSRLAAAAHASGGDPGEAWRVARVIGLLRIVPEAYQMSVADGLVNVPLAVWVWLTHGLERHTTGLAAVREPAMVIACLVLLTTWLIAWQIGLGWFARAAAVLVVGVPPVAATLLAGRVSGGPMAAAALGVAVLVLDRRHLGAGSITVAVLAAGFAVLVAPPVTPAVLVGLAVLLLTAYEGRAGLRLAVAELAVGGAVVLLLGVVLGGGSLRWSSAQAIAVPALSRVEWLIVAAVTAVAVLAVGVPAARIWVYVLGALAVTGVVDSQARADVLTVAIPVAALLVVVMLEPAVGHRAPRQLRAMASFSVTGRPDSTLAVLIAGCLGLTMATGFGPVDPAPVPPPDVRPVAEWLRSEPASTPSVLVSDELWPDLVAADVPAKWLRTTSGLGGAARPQWAVAVAGSPPPVRLDSAPVATFGYGVGRVLLYRLGDATPGERGQSGTGSRRISAGLALTHNPQVRLSAPARTALRGGDVDLRLVLVLAELAAQHGLTIAGFPVVTGEKPGTPPMRRVLVSWIDGQPADQQGAADLVLTWLGNQQPPYRPRSADVTKAGLLIRYPYVPPGI